MSIIIPRSEMLRSSGIKDVQWPVFIDISRFDLEKNYHSLLNPAVVGVCICGRFSHLVTVRALILFIHESHTS